MADTPSTATATGDAQEAGSVPPQAQPTQQQAAQEAGDVAQEAAAPKLSEESARKLQSENRAMRKRLEELEAAQRAADDAKLSEHERLTKQNAELAAQMREAQAALRDSRTRLAVEREARALKLVDEDAAYRLLDHAQIEYGEDGEPKNVRPLLKKLAESKPYLVARDAAPDQAQPPAGSAIGTNGAIGGGGAPLGGTPRPDTGRALSQQEQDARRAAVGLRARAYF